MVALHEQMAILAESLSQQEFGAGDLSPEDIQTAVDNYLSANPVGIPAHNDTTGRAAADAHPMSAITGLVSELEGKQAAGSYATTGDLSGYVAGTGVSSIVAVEESDYPAEPTAGVLYAVLPDAP